MPISSITKYPFLLKLLKAKIKVFKLDIFFKSHTTGDKNLKTIAYIPLGSVSDSFRL